MGKNEELINSIYHIGDIFEYDKDIISDDAFKYLQEVKTELLNTTDRDVVDACIDVICTAFLHISHLDEFDISFLKQYLDKESNQITENVVTIMGSSGKTQYKDIICKYLLSNNHNIADAAKEALENLNFIAQQKEH